MMNSGRPAVFITGTSRGLGRGIALDLARSYHVIGAARGAFQYPPDLANGQTIDHREGIDVARTKDLDQLVPDLGRCVALVNNVGVAYDGILATQSLESIEQIINVNLTSILYLTKLYIRERLAIRQPGNVVTIGSIVASRGYRGLAAYSASKGALAAMTRALAREMGAKGFRFNIVHPGYIETEMSKGLSDEQREMIVRRTPLGRLATIDDVTPVVRFLLSDESRFITGQEIVVDGGLTA